MYLLISSLQEPYGVISLVLSMEEEAEAQRH